MTRQNGTIAITATQIKKNCNRGTTLTASRKKHWWVGMKGDGGLVGEGEESFWHNFVFSTLF